MRFSLITVKIWLLRCVSTIVVWLVLISARIVRRAVEGYGLWDWTKDMDGGDEGVG